MKLVTQFLTYGIAIALCIGVFVAADKSEAKAEANQVNNAVDFARAIPVTANKVTKQNITESSSFPGTIRASEETKLAFRVSGPLIELNVKPGDTIKKDQPLIKIDPRDFQDSISVLEAKLVNANASLENAKQDYSRTKQLFNDKVLPQSDFDHASNALAIANAELKETQANIEIAKHRLQDTILKAPYDCIVTEQNIENFEMVSAGQNVLVVQNISNLEIDVFIPENKINAFDLKKGLEGTVNFPAIANRTFDAKLTEWQINTDPTSKTYKLTFTMPDPKVVQILPGMTTNVTIESTENTENTFIIPESCILEQYGKSFVWVYQPQDKTAVRKYIKTSGFNGKNNIIVIEGLNSGDLVITQGYNHVTEKTQLNATIID